MLGIVLCAVFVFVFAATDASAVEWLVNGQEVKEALKAETEGAVEMIVYNGKEKLSEPLMKFLCNGISLGTIGPGASGEITEILTLTQEALGKDQLKGSENTLSGNPMLCKVTFDAGSLEDCKEGENAAELWPANLPWKTEIVLEGTDVLALVTGTNGEPGWEAECTALIGIKGSNLCEATSGARTMLVENEEKTIEGFPPGVLGFFNELADNEMGSCTFTGELTTEMISNKGESSNIWAIGVNLERLETSISGN